MISRKKKYLKKRYWFLLLFFLLVLLGKTEFLKMRYSPKDLLKTLSEAGQVNAEFKEKKLDGRSLHYLQIIKHDTLPTVVLVHGSPGALSAYENYLSDTIFSRGLNLIAIDRPGFGYSDFGQAELSLAQQAAMLAVVLADFPNSPKIAVGHSMGGPVISKTAISFPALVDGLVLIAPALSPKLEPSARWRKILNLSLFRLLTPPAFRVCNQEIIPLKEELETMLPGWQNLHLPVTVIQGVEDPLVPAGNADFVAQMATNATELQIKMIEGGDHFILWSETELIKKAILNMAAGF